MASRNPTEFLNSVLLYPGPSEIPYAEDMKWTIRSHIFDLIQEFEGMCIKLKNYTRPDGRVVLLLVLEGTLPIYYRGTRYNIPVVLWLPEKYPRQAPALYVTPTPDMIIKPNHSFVDHTGLVRSVYINSWQHPRSNLNELAHDTAIQFGTEPPLFSKPPGWSGAMASGPGSTAASPQQQGPHHLHQHYSPQHHHQHSQQQQQHSPLQHHHSAAGAASIRPPGPPLPPPPAASLPIVPPPPPTGQASGPPSGSGVGRLGTAVPAGAPGAAATGATVQVHNPLQQGQAPTGAFGRMWDAVPSTSSPASAAAATQPASEPPVPSRTELLDAFRKVAIDTLTRRLRAGMREERTNVDTEVQELHELQSLLQQRGAMLDRAVAAAAAERDALESGLQDMAVKRVEMESWLEEYEAKVPKSVDDIDPDEAILPSDELSRQALEAHALDLAIEESLYAVDKALQRGLLQPEVYLKQVRQLCRKQYYARALGNKVAARQQRAAAAARSYPPAATARGIPTGVGSGAPGVPGRGDEPLSMPQGDSWVSTGVLPNPLAAMR